MKLQIQIFLTRFCILTFFLILLTPFVNAQNGPNVTIVKQSALVQKLRSLRKSASDTALNFANFVVEQAKATNDKSLECEAMLEMGRIYLGKSDQTIALEKMIYAESISTINDNCYYSSPQVIGFILNRQGKADEALQYLFKALKRAEDVNYKVMAIGSTFAIADAYRENKNSAKAMGYALKGLQFSEASKDTGNLITAYGTLSNILSNNDYVNSQRLDSAVAYLEKLMRPPFINNTKFTPPYDSAKNFANMGRLYRMQEKFDLAKQHLAIGLEVATRRGFRALEQSTINELATLELWKGNQEKALLLSQQARQILPSNQTSVNRIKEIEDRAKEANEEIGNYKGAYENLVASDKLKDSLYSIKKQAAITDVEKKYERDTKLLKATNLALQKESERNLIVVAAIFIIICISALFIWRIYKRRQQNKFLQTLIHEVNHRTKNNLQMLNSLITGIYHNVSDEGLRVEIKKLRSYIKSFGLVYDNLNRTASFDDVDIAIYTKDIGKAVINNQTNEELEFIYNSNTQINISTDKAILVGLIVNELITNSLKHAFNSSTQKQISISVDKPDDKQVRIVYNDNGQGQINNNTSSNSFGMGMIQQLVKQLKGIIIYDANNVKKITITIPTT